jgi:hypothetical protein
MDDQYEDFSYEILNEEIGENVGRAIAAVALPQSHLGWNIGQDLRIIQSEIVSAVYGSISEGE